MITIQLFVNLLKAKKQTYDLLNKGPSYFLEIQLKIQNNLSWNTY